MILPTTPEHVKNEILISSQKLDEVGDLRTRQLIKVLSAISDALIVEGIIQVFEIEDDSNNNYTAQEICGRILTELKPQYEGDLILVLIRVTKNWNKSVVQLPFWMKDNYGLRHVAEKFHELEDSGVSSIEADKLNTMRWWLKIDKSKQDKTT